MKLSRYKKFFKYTTLLIIFFVVLIILINLYVIAYASPYIYSIEDIDELETKTTALSLGAKVHNGGTLSYVLKDRVDHAITLFEQNKVSTLLFSGDHGRDSYDEVNAMLNYAVSKGIKKQAIFLDHAGFSTYETMYRAKEVFLCEELIVITQKFHIYRSVYIARRLGIDAIGVSSNQHEYYLSTDIKNNLRECLARIKDFVYVEIYRPTPAYLGETIPISGDSFKSHDQ
jgi:SanA protein